MFAAASSSSDAGAVRTSAVSEGLIKQKSLQIKVGSDNLKILKSCESLFNDVINKKFQCTSKLESVMDATKVFRKILPSQIELSVWKDDLTRHTVDAVVNAANEHLRHCGGLALALLRAGGPIIEEDSKKIIEQYGKVPTTKIAVTSGGLLPCSKIIHAVGPEWKAEDAQRCCTQLQITIINILNYVVSGSSVIRTVAIPALSSGIFGFPLDMCVNIIVNTIVTFPSFQRSNILKEIHLVSNEDPTVAAFKRSCENFLCGNIAAAPPLASITLNNVNLQLIEGFIEKQQVDVIVNSVSAQNSFESGCISKAILNQAGPEIEKEFFEKMVETSKNQELVIITTGFNLACQYVFHIVWPSYNNTKKTLKAAVKKCLEKSHQKNINSLSFPALGTGSIGIQKEAAVHIMLEEVLQFSKDYPKKKLLVNFVIFPNDSELSKAFRSELAKMKTKQIGHMAPKMNKESDKELKVPPWFREGQEEAELEEAQQPLIHLIGNNEEQLVAAKKWIVKLLRAQECCFIEDNHIFYLGKEEHDRLSYLKNKFEVSISEEISSGKATLEIRGKPNSIIPVMLHIENLLWVVQRAYTEKHYCRLAECQFAILPQDRNLFELDFWKEKKLWEKKIEFEKVGLEAQKVEMVHNVILSAAFENKKMIQSKKAHGNTRRMLYQEVPQHFCDLVSKVGFQRIYSMPPDHQYGDGIYFRKSLKNLVDNLRRTSDSDRVICVFEAEVVIGSYCEGNPSYISPPPLGSRTMDTYDSVVDNVKNPETFVIFDSTRALPHFLWTCVLKKSGFSQMEAKNRGSKGSSV
ncbi:protein mono-ADP-ribosyltransferase PARP9 [Vombatus ursinus]|uniref:Poly(ADP-ribose) polymerase family member 9 n=1 Tax=Vombatus ursinus TaxID=29139 RepID=A0A4X2KBY2_VOMUR|nr:protein mono-ADP-ribosyltransferase PARP9 [Vombatus ursinus]XP_027701012.1 protein mono-ADP-ribosyltransferase PARP9 [Vombatus ursinus]